MRCLGEIDGQAHAEKFVAHLLTLDISTQLETVRNSSKWEIWVREEDRLGEAGRELKAFEGNPNDAKYDEAVAKARKILEEKEKARLEAIKNVRKVDTRSSPRHLAAGGKLPPEWRESPGRLADRSQQLNRHAFIANQAKGSELLYAESCTARYFFVFISDQGLGQQLYIDDIALLAGND